MKIKSKLLRGQSPMPIERLPYGQIGRLEDGQHVAHFGGVVGCLETGHVMHLAGDERRRHEPLMVRVCRSVSIECEFDGFEAPYMPHRPPPISEIIGRIGATAKTPSQLFAEALMAGVDAQRSAIRGV